MTKLTIYYDYTDPWCFLAVSRADWLRGRLGDLDLDLDLEIEVAWHPFELYPDLPTKGARPRNPAFFRRKTQYDIDERARDLGLTIHVPMDWVTNSRLALAGSLFAREAGPFAFDAYHRAVFAAYFTDRRDIGQLDTIVAIADEGGLDGEQCREALISGTYADEIMRLRGEAAGLGVAAIPTFVANNQGAIGIVSDENLLRLVTTSSPPVAAVTHPG